MIIILLGMFISGALDCLTEPHDKENACGFCGAGI